MYVSSTSLFCSGVRPSVSLFSHTDFTRAKSVSFRRTSSRRAESRGETFRVIAWISSFVSAPESVKKTSETLASCRPPFSSASTVFANVAGSVLDAIASISFLRSAIPASNAGTKCSGRIFSNAGIPNGVAHSVKNGFVSVFGSAAG